MQPLAGFFWIWGEVFRLCIGKAPPDQCCQPFLFTFLDGQPIHPWVSYGCSEHIYLVYKLKFPEAPKWSFQKLQNGASRSFKMKLPEAHPGSSKMELLRMFMLKIPGSSILNQKLQNEAASLSWEASIWSCQPSNGAASFKSKLPGWASGSLEAQKKAASSKTKLLGRLGILVRSKVVIKTDARVGLGCWWIMTWEESPKAHMEFWGFGETSKAS